MPAVFRLPTINDNLKGWGPPANCTLPRGKLNANFESFDKYPWQKVGRICDFTASGQRWAEQRAAKGKGKGKGLPLRQAGSDEEGFELVDSRPVFGKSRGRGTMGKGKQKGKGIAVNYQEGILGQKQKPFFQMDNKGKGKGGKAGKAKGKGAGSFQQRRGLPSFKDWSVQVKSEWSLVQEIMLSALAKLQIDSRDVQMEDLLWCGQLHQYDKIHDRVTPKLERPLQRFEELNFFNVSTTDDPMLPQYLQEDPSITVIATDHVLASLIAAARSIYSWDIVITKISGKLIFDKRDGSHIDFLTVDETAQEPPNNDDINSINAPVKLGQEASCINQNFSQMVLDYSVGAEEMEHTNPFDEEDEEAGRAASGAYRYRKITIPGNPKDEESEFKRSPVSIAVRTEVNCKIGDDHYVSVKAVNEYDQRKGQAWRKYLDSQRGAVLATVLKDNAFKLGRWTAQAILSGCDMLKLGYISRKDDMDPWTHSCLTVTTYQVDGFAEQIGMTNNNVFGILRSIIDLVMSLDDGKYVLLKDPTKSVMRLFEVPWDTFGEDEGDEEDEEEEEGDDQQES